MRLLKGSLEDCVNQAIAEGLGVPVSSIRTAKGQWRFIYL